MNGWIFPYRPWTGKTETVSTNLRLVVVPSFGLVSPRGVGTPVPQTDTGGQVENTKAIERILVKELGKSLPCLRYKGDPLG